MPPTTADKMGQGSGAPTATTLVLTTTTIAANVGDVVTVVSAFHPGASSDTVVFTDNHGNTWATDINAVQSPGFNAALSIGHSKITTQIPIGGTITATYSGSRTLRQICAFVNHTDTYVAPVTLDGAPVQGNGTTSTSLNPGSMTPTQVPDFAVAAYTNSASAAGLTGTPPSGFTEMFDFSVNTTNSLQVNVRTALTSDTTTAISPTETLSGAPTQTVCALVLYECVSGVVVAPSELALLGVG